MYCSLIPFTSCFFHLDRSACVVFAKDNSLIESTTSTDLSAVSQQDVTLSAETIAEFGLPPRVYNYNFRKCYFCKYSCTFQFPFAKQQADMTTCSNNCAKQDFCTEWVTPEFKAPVAPYAIAWRQAYVPLDLALRLKLATAVTTASQQVIYKPAYVPWPWACASPIEYVTPEYKPEPAQFVVPQCFVTPDYNTAAFASPIRALKMYLTNKMIASLKLSPFTQHQVYYIGN